MTARAFWPVFSLALVFMAGCQPGADETDSVADEDTAPTIPVETATPSRGDIFAVYSGTAPIEAFADATVIAKVGGEVREILVEGHAFHHTRVSAAEARSRFADQPLKLGAR